MKVSELQAILKHVGALMEAGGGKASAELATFRETLEPFREQTAKQFAATIQKLTAAPPPAKQPKKTGKLKADEAEALIREVGDLYDRAAAMNTTIEQINEATSRLSSLDKAGLVMVAQRISLVGMDKKPIKDIIAAIQQRITSRHGAAQKGNRMDRSPYMVGAE